MKVVGVIDLLHGVTVRAVQGHRDRYRPVRSRLCDSSDPLRIAKAFRDHHGIADLYVADLDAILGRSDNATIVARLVADGFRVALDAGLRSADDIDRVVATGAAIVVAGLETLAGPADLEELVTRVGPDRLAFSLDLVDGVPLGDPTAWGESRWDVDAVPRVVRRAVECGVERMIVLDLRAVGTADGPVTIGLCRQIKSSMPNLQLWTGGGLRDSADLRTLADAGVDGVLIASALHDGTLVDFRAATVTAMIVSQPLPDGRGSDGEIVKPARQSASDVSPDRRCNPSRVIR